VPKILGRSSLTSSVCHVCHIGRSISLTSSVCHVGNIMSFISNIFCVPCTSYRSRGQTRLEDKINVDSHLFPGCPLTKSDLLKALQALQAKHKSSRASMDDLLNLVSAVFPDFKDASALQMRGYLRRVTRLLDHQKVYHICKCQNYTYKDDIEGEGTCPKCGERRYKDNELAPQKEQVIATCMNGCSIYTNHHINIDTTDESDGSVQYLYEHAQRSRCEECKQMRFVRRRDTSIPIRYEMCVNGCAVFFNHGELTDQQIRRQAASQNPNSHFQNRSRQYMYAADRKCAICGAFRYKVGTEPWSVYRHVSLIGQLQDMFLNEAMAKQLLLPVTLYDKNDIRNLYESPAWQKGVIGDKEFSKERRNVALALCADGANPFRSGVQSWTPLMMCILNAPEHLRKKRDSMILVGLCGPKAPNMCCILDIVVDELHTLYYKGCIMRYYDGENFIFRAKLILTVGDYPGQCKMAAMSGHVHTCGCSKCLVRGVQVGDRKLVVRCAKRHLPIHHPMRVTNPNIGFPPSRRRSSTIVYEGRLVRNKIPSASGVNGCSPLARLGYFNLVRDMPIDVMHLIQGFKNHLIPLFKGDRPGGESLGLPLSQREQDIVDLRFAGLKIPSNVCRLSNKPFAHTGKMTGYDFQVVFSMFAKTLFYDMFSDNRVYDLICKLQEIFRCILNHIVTVSLLPALRQKIVETLVKWETVMPHSEQVTVVHLLLHVCDDMQYFGPVRNYWMYCFERYISLLAQYAKSRRFVGASIINMYCYSRAFIHAKPESRARLSTALGSNDPFGIGLAVAHDHDHMDNSSEVVCSSALSINGLKPEDRIMAFPSSVQMYIVSQLRVKCASFRNLYVKFLLSKSRPPKVDVSGFYKWQESTEGQQTLQSLGLTSQQNNVGMDPAVHVRMHVPLIVKDFARARVNPGHRRMRGILFRTSLYERQLVREGKSPRHTDSYCWFFHKRLERDDQYGSEEKWYGQIKYLVEATFDTVVQQIAVLQRLRLYEVETGVWQIFQGEFNGYRILHMPPNVIRPLVCCPISQLKRLVVAAIPSDDLYWTNYKFAIEVDTSVVATSDSL
jgi:hypothetical protein